MFTGRSQLKKRIEETSKFFELPPFAGLLLSVCSLPVRYQPREPLTAIQEPLPGSRKTWFEHAGPDLCFIWPYAGEAGRTLAPSERAIAQLTDGVMKTTNTPETSGQTSTFKHSGSMHRSTWRAILDYLPMSLKTSGFTARKLTNWIKLNTSPGFGWDAMLKSIGHK